ncbi:hypothetical protein HELRODRAFT_167573 [Helobdella robusta]|uniref:Uncharacterized protein n=1 Tax=Helobdella robusta TaxID=6412 RepID=T1EZI2_HELRO|nr:hypothetical protein HELRODRAFT_167573 [Helobdella robusta]ESO11051.1 hypothetical protein HELRODRAFT_167573 [Helobdella robusta]
MKVKVRKKMNVKKKMKMKVRKMMKMKVRKMMRMKMRKKMKMKTMSVKTEMIDIFQLNVAYQFCMHADVWPHKHQQKTHSAAECKLNNVSQALHVTGWDLFAIESGDYNSCARHSTATPSRHPYWL